MMVPTLTLASLLVAYQQIVPVTVDETHVHVVESSESAQSGAPLKDIKVYYGFDGHEFYFGTTDDRGVARGKFDVSQFGGKTKFKLYLRNMDETSILFKDIDWKTKEEYDDGFAVTVYRPQQLVGSVMDTSQRVVAESGECPSCDSVMAYTAPNSSGMYNYCDYFEMTGMQCEQLLAPPPQPLYYLVPQYYYVQ